MSGAFEPLPSSFIRLKTGDSSSWSRIQTEMAEQDDGEQERDAPAPGLEACAVPRAMRQPRMTISERNRPRVAVVWMKRGEVAALAVGGVLGHVGGRAAVLAAQRQALQEAQGDEDDRRRDAERGVAGQDADDERRRRPS